MCGRMILKSSIITGGSVSTRKVFFAVCLAMIVFVRLNAQTQRVTFIYEPKPGESINSIAAAGSFNHWNSTKDLFKKLPDGKFALTLELKEGLHYYKFVINGTKWLEDPKADVKYRKEDGFGGFNSVIVVGESGAMYGEAVENEINTDALKHDSNSIEHFNVIMKDLAEIKIRTLEDDASEVKIVFDDGDSVKMRKVKSYIGFDWYSAFIDIPIEKKSLKYRFAIIDEAKKVLYPAENHFTASLSPKFLTPDWAKNAVWYQIMPDRFYDGDTTNNPDGFLPWTWDFAKVHPSEKGSFYDVVWGRRFGGDILGLIKKLDYLKELGVTAIYLTPVFEADSPHKYNTSDYRHVDDNLGFKGDIAELKGETDDPKTWKWTKTDRLFLDFLKTARAKGFRVIIDGVFNHSGEKFWAFEDVKKHGEKSKYADWFDITDWDLFMREADRGKGYRGWAGFGGLPEFREDGDGLVKGPKEHIFAITRRWMDPNGDGDPSDGIDGWRLDVVDNVAMPFWVEWSKLVKSINPDALIVGELWGESPEWLNEKLLHCQMNYPFVKTILKFISDKQMNPSQFDGEIKRLLALYPYQVNFVQQNLLDSHDTDRAVSMLYNPGRHYDKRNRLNPQDTGDYNPYYKTERPPKEIYELLKLVSALQFTLPGAPMIWYGTEAGMWGSDDPFCREPMTWKEFEPYDSDDRVFMDEIFKHYQKLIAIRNTYPELQSGIYESVHTDDTENILVFARRKGNRSAFIVVNASEKKNEVVFKASLPNNSKLLDVYSEKVVIFNSPESDGRYNFSRKKIKTPEKPAKTYSVKNGKVSVRMPPRSAMFLVSMDK